MNIVSSTRLSLYCSISDEPDGKRYVLLDADRWFDKIFTCWDHIDRFGGTGHSEWEMQLGFWFEKAIQEARSTSSTEADITEMFSHRLHAELDMFYSAAQVRDHLIYYPRPGENVQSCLKFTFLSEKEGIVYLAAPANW